MYPVGYPQHKTHHLERRNAIRVQVRLMMNALLELLVITRLTLVILSVVVEPQNAKNEMVVPTMIERVEPLHTPCSPVQIHVERLDQLYIMRIQVHEHETAVMLIAPPVMALIRIIVSPELMLMQRSMGPLHAHEILTITTALRHPR